MCGQPLVYDDGDPNCYNNDEIYLSEDGTPEGDVDMNREITCQNCGCHVIAWHYAGCEDEEQFPGPVSEQGFGHCFMCGGTLVWGNDFMRSDLEPDIESEEDDSLVRELTCSGCNSAFTVYEPSPNEMKKYPYWQSTPTSK